MPVRIGARDRGHGKPIRPTGKQHGHSIDKDLRIRNISRPRVGPERDSVGGPNSKTGDRCAQRGGNRSIVLVILDECDIGTIWLRPVIRKGAAPPGLIPTRFVGVPVHPVIGELALIYPGKAENVSASKLGFGMTCARAVWHSSSAVAPPATADRTILLMGLVFGFIGVC